MYDFRRIKKSTNLCHPRNPKKITRSQHDDHLLMSYYWSEKGLINDRLMIWDVAVQTLRSWSRFETTSDTLSGLDVPFNLSDSI